MSDSWTNWLAPFAEDFSLRVAITLLHFLWQGVAIGAVVLLTNRILRTSSATSRYLLHTVALLLLPLCVVMTFAVAEVPSGWRPVTTEELVTASSNSSTEFEPAVSPEGLGDVTHGMSSLPANEVEQETVLRDPSVAAAQGTEHQDPTSEPTAKPQIQPLFPKLAQLIVLAYFLGVGLLLLRLAIAMWGGHRLRSASNSIDDSHLLRVVASQARKIGLRLVPAIRYCERVSVPVVVGVLRPVILLPASLITGLAPDQFAAIISHELAHIRRYDLLVNLLQRVVESVLFFHPIVWYLGHRMSTERETCCDDLVVSSGYEPMHYAGALLRMAEICSTPLSVDAHALAASGDHPSQLETRIWRLVNMNRESRFRMTRAGSLMIGLLTLTVIGMPAIVHSLAQADEVKKQLLDESDKKGERKDAAKTDTSQSVDATTKALYSQYIAGSGKIETKSVQAAIELVAARGHRDPKFRALLMKDFVRSCKEKKSGKSRTLLDLIAKVLMRDGGPRWQRDFKRPGDHAQIPSQRAEGGSLDGESKLLAHVIEYGRKCGRSEIDAFVFAVRQAHHPQGKQFLLDVLHNPSVSDPFVNGNGNAAKGKWPDNLGGSWRDARFHAAIGLAEINVEDGVRWLIEHARPNNFGLDGSVYRHPHSQVRSGSLRKNCDYALRDLSGTQGEQDWDKWWRENEKTFTPRRPVSLKP